MTHEEVKKGLECCLAPLKKCDQCPMKPYANCTHVLKHAALIHMRELEEKVSLMMIQMQGDCGVCKHKDAGFDAEPCASCITNDECASWEYEGLPEVSSHGRKE